tara:strand:- start:438 stop:665 length:228 start_codon:yes stop_codon:yes gene_type:complete
MESERLQLYGIAEYLKMRKKPKWAKLIYSFIIFLEEQDGVYSDSDDDFDYSDSEGDALDEGEHVVIRDGQHCRLF